MFLLTDMQALSSPLVKLSGVISLSSFQLYKLKEVIITLYLAILFHRVASSENSQDVKYIKIRGGKLRGKHAMLAGAGNRNILLCHKRF